MLLFPADRSARPTAGWISAQEKKRGRLFCLGELSNVSLALRLNNLSKAQLPQTFGIVGLGKNPGDNQLWRPDFQSRTGGSNPAMVNDSARR